MKGQIKIIIELYNFDCLKSFSSTILKKLFLNIKKPFKILYIKVLNGFFYIVSILLYEHN